MVRKDNFLPPEEFLRRAVLRLRKGQAKSIHSVFSGFNAAWRQYYNTDPVAGVKALEKKGVCVTHPTRGGVRIYPCRGCAQPAPSTEEVVGIILARDLCPQLCAITGVLAEHIDVLGVRPVYIDEVIQGYLENTRVLQIVDPTGAEHVEPVGRGYVENAFSRCSPYK